MNRPSLPPVNYRRSMVIVLLIPLIALLYSFLGAVAPKQVFKDLKFKFIGNEIIIPVVVNDKDTLDMLLDTGTDPSVMDIDKARELGLEIKTKGVKGSGVGTAKIIARRILIKKIQIAGFEYSDFETYSADLSKIGKKTGHAVFGVIGYNFLKDKIFEIDYRNEVIHFYKDYTGKEDINYFVKTSFFLTRNIPAINNASLNGVNLSFCFDTGSSLYLAMSFRNGSEKKFSIDLKDTIHIIAIDTIVGYLGKGIVKTSPVNDFSLGTILVNALPVTTDITNNMRGIDYGDYGAALGNKFLKDYKILFDYKKKMVYIY